MKRSLSIGLVALLVTGMLIGCSGANDTTADTSGSDTADSSEPVVIRFAARSESGNVQVARDKKIEQFQEEHPNIIVEREELPQADFWVKIPAELASGEGPDVIELPYLEQGVSFAARGLLEPLDSYMDGENGIDRDDLVEGISSFGVYGDDTLLLPVVIMTTGLGYNKDMFDTAGVDYPDADWTWDDMLAAAMKLTLDSEGNNAESADFNPDDIVQWGIYNWWWNSDFDLYMWTFGGDWLNEDGTECTLDSPEVLEALTFYADLTQKYHVAPYVRELAPAHGHPALMSEQVAMAVVDVGNIILVEDAGINWDIAPIPYNAEVGTRAAFMYGSGVSILKDSEHKEAAWELVKYLSSSQMDSELVKEGYGFPAYKSQYEALEFSPKVSVLYQMVEDGWAKAILASDYEGVVVSPANTFIAGALTKGEYPDYKALLEQANEECNMALQEAPELPK